MIDDRIIELAKNLYNNKLSRPAYAEYKTDDDLQQLLFQDCLTESQRNFEMGLAI